MNSRQILFLGPIVALQAHSEVYMTEAQARSAIFPNETFVDKAVELSADEAKKIEELSGVKVRSKSVKLWKTDSGNLVFIDQVLGKHEYITIAVGVLAKSQTVAGVEILEYHESYGQGVRKPDFTSQYVGKDKSATLKVGSDIKNLSGATLSSVHLTEGIRRLLQTYDIIKERI